MTRVNSITAKLVTLLWNEMCNEYNNIIIIIIIMNEIRI